VQGQKSEKPVRWVPQVRSDFVFMFRFFTVKFNKRTLLVFILYISTYQVENINVYCIILILSQNAIFHTHSISGFEVRDESEKSLKPDNLE